MTETNSGYEVRLKLSKSNASEGTKTPSFDLTVGREIGEVLRTGKTVKETYGRIDVEMNVIFYYDELSTEIIPVTQLNLRIFNHEIGFEVESKVLLTTDDIPAIHKVHRTHLFTDDGRATPALSFDANEFSGVKTLKELTEKIHELVTKWVAEKSAEIGGFPESI